MKDEEIREKAKKKVEEKKGFYIVAFIFGSLSLILLILSFNLPYPASFWVAFPIPIFAMVLGIMYLSIFGVPGSNLLSQEWEEEELAREINRQYRKQKLNLPTDPDLSEEDHLELRELERLKRKWEDPEDFV